MCFAHCPPLAKEEESGEEEKKGHPCVHVYECALFTQHAKWYPIVNFESSTKVKKIKIKKNYFIL